MPGSRVHDGVVGNHRQSIADAGDVHVKAGRILRCRQARIGPIVHRAGAVDDQDLVQRSAVYTTLSGTGIGGRGRGLQGHRQVVGAVGKVGRIEQQPVLLLDKAAADHRGIHAIDGRGEIGIAQSGDHGPTRSVGHQHLDEELVIGLDAGHGAAVGHLDLQDGIGAGEGDVHLAGIAQAAGNGHHLGHAVVQEGLGPVRRHRPAHAC